VTHKGGQQGDASKTVRFAITVTTFPSFGRVFARHAACTGAAICNDVFIVALFAEGLALAAELKQVLKQDFKVLPFGLQSSQRFQACPTDPDDTLFGLHFPTDSQIQADPSLNEKTWHLNWMPLAFLTSFQLQRFFF